MLITASDLHLQLGGMFARPAEKGLTTWGLVGLACVDWLIDRARELKPEIILIGGDVFSQKNNIPVPLFNRAYKKFDELCEVSKVIAIPGNHDRFMQSTDPETNSLYALGRGIKNFFLIDSPDTLETPHYRVTGVPAGMDIPKIKFGRAKENILLLHEKIIGAKMESGALAEEGYQRKGLLAVLEKFGYDYCFCGDIHRPQAIIENRIIVIGAPYQQEFGDENQDRGIWTLSNRGTGFLRYKEGPRFLTVTDRNYDQYRNKLTLQNTYVRFQISKPAYREDLEKRMAKDPTFFKNQTVVEYTVAVGEDEYTPTDFSKQRNLVGEYVKTMASLDKNLDKRSLGKLTSVGLKYFDRAKEAMNG